MASTIGDIGAMNSELASDFIDAMMPALGDSFESQAAGLLKTWEALLSGGGTMPQEAILGFAMIGFNTMSAVWVERNRDKLREAGQLPLGE